MTHLQCSQLSLAALGLCAAVASSALAQPAGAIDAATVTRHEASLAAALTTAETAAQDRRAWSCSTSRDGEPARALVMRLGEDGSSQVGRRAGRWSLRGDTLALEFGELRTTLEALRIDSAGDKAVLTARSGSGESVRCTLLDAAHRNPAGVFEDEGVSPIAAALAGTNLGRTESEWSCSLGGADGVVLGRSVSYHGGGRGMLDGNAMRWYVDEYGEVFMSGPTGVSVFSDVRIDLVNAPDVFTANEGPAEVRCRRV